MIVRSEEEIRILREGGIHLKRVIEALISEAKPGVAAFDLDRLAFSMTERMGDRPSFLNYKPYGVSRPYPFSVCISINNEVVHGLPTKNKILKDGDVVSIDMGLIHKGLFLDSAVTIQIGSQDTKAQNLIKVTKNALEAAISQAKTGNRTGDIGYVVEKIGTENGFGVVRDLAGHGVGRAVHEEPFIPNYGIKGKGHKLQHGLVIAIEPMLNEGTAEVVLGGDGFTYYTVDGKRSAHFEHTILILDQETIILTK
jgi:methionyl aminopeptidase